MAEVNFVGSRWYPTEVRLGAGNQCMRTYRIYRMLIVSRLSVLGTPFSCWSCRYLYSYLWTLGRPGHRILYLDPGRIFLSPDSSLPGINPLYTSCHRTLIFGIQKTPLVTLVRTVSWYILNFDMYIKGTVQQDGSGYEKVHSIARYKEWSVEIFFYQPILHPVSARSNIGIPLAQFQTAWSFHCASSCGWGKDDNQNMFTAPLATGSKFVHCAIANNCM